jgi:hypothetical protein
MLRAHIPPTTERTSGQSSKKSAKSKNQIYLFLDLRTNGQNQAKYWEKISLSHGELSMLNTVEVPAVAMADTSHGEHYFTSKILTIQSLPMKKQIHSLPPTGKTRLS